MTVSRILTLSDANSAAHVISQAFMEDPLISFMLPMRRSRFQTLLQYFRPMTDLSVKSKKVYGIGHPLQGVAYWKAPDQRSMSVSIKNLFKFLPILFSPFPLGAFRAREIVRKTEAMHDRYADQPHYYLENLGVLAEARGNGWSSALIRPILENADRQNVIAYTDTVTRANVPLYEHFGFQLMEEALIPNTGITVFALRRSARV